MKEIKFRGKCIKTGRWVYGYLTIGADSYFIEERHDLPPTMQDPCGDTIISRDRIDHKTIGQFTGLKDKNGVDIYEGDISKYGYVILFNSEKGLFAEHDKVRLSIMSYPIDRSQIEIIGNIHQNEIINE